MVGLLVLVFIVNVLTIDCDFDSGDSEKSLVQGYISLVPGLRTNLGKKCFKDIGCFSGQEFRDFKKGVPHLPMTPNSISPEFRVYTLNNTKKGNILRYNPSIDDLKATSFNPKDRTILIVHGFRSDIEEWMIALKDMIFRQLYNNYNVVLVTWGRGSKVNSYFLAVANTRVVGALMAFFVNRLCELFDMRNNMFHLIGHSLGAHIAGFAGKRLFDPKVDLITALDPAGPGFADGLPSLENTDAKRVVVLHTDMGLHAVTEGLGNVRVLGDVDFFPNGGKLQPGCAHAGGVYGALRAIANEFAISCSHQRAYDLATSLGKPGQECLPVGYECLNWETFLEGRCADCGQDNSKCFLMGLYLWYWRGIPDFSEDQKEKITKKYFLNTGAVEDYCLFHYQIAFHIKKDSTVNSGYLGIHIKGKIGKETKDLTIERKLSKVRPGSIHTLLFTSNWKLDSVLGISIQWNTKNSKIQKSSQQNEKLNIEFVEYNFMSHIYKKVRDKLSAVFCPFEGEGDDEDNEDNQLNFIKCKPGEAPKKLARNSEPDLLVPITNHKDILVVDYEKIDKVAHKIVNSNLIHG